MIYQLLLTIGGLGLTAQVFLGFAHGGHGQAHGHAGGHNAGHHAGASHGHGTHNGHGNATHTEQNSLAPRVNVSLALWLSPLNLFSLALGSGATGMALRPLHLGEVITALCAALGGLAVVVLIVRPVWAMIMRFVSTPAETLAGVVSQEGIAVSRFDARGQGVVRVSVDGQTVRLLGRLDRDEQGASPAIAPGDRLLVTGIDGTRNQCRVTKL